MTNKNLKKCWHIIRDNIQNTPSLSRIVSQQEKELERKVRSHMLIDMWTDGVIDADAVAHGLNKIDLALVQDGSNISKKRC